MPNKKTKSRSTLKEISPRELENKTQLPAENSLNDGGEKKKIVFPTLLLVLIIVAVLFFSAKEKFLTTLGSISKGKLIVAVINGKPIFKSELDKKLVSSFGAQTLENIIIEKLLYEEAAKKSITVTDEDVKKEVENLTKSLGEGLKLEDVLKFQGLTVDDFNKQIKTRLLVNKILEKEITITDDELSKYIKDNIKVLTSTTEADRKQEATDKLKEQKIGEKVQTLVSDLLSKAKISRFLK